MISVVVCKVRDREILMDAMEIKSIEPVSKITGILGMPDYIQGVMQCKDALLTMIDLEYVFFGTSMQPNELSRTLVVSWSSKQYGLMVTDAHDFIQLENANIGEVEPDAPYLRKIWIEEPREVVDNDQESEETEQEAIMVESGQLLVDLNALLSYLAQLENK